MAIYQCKVATIPNGFATYRKANLCEYIATVPKVQITYFKHNRLNKALLKKDITNEVWTN